MPETIIGTPIHWAGQRCNVTKASKEGTGPVKAIFNEGTFTKTSELEVIKGPRGDIITRVYHGFNATMKLTGFPSDDTLPNTDKLNLPPVGSRLKIEFLTQLGVVNADDERNGWYEVTNADMSATNTGNTVWTLDLVRSVDQTTT